MLLNTKVLQNQLPFFCRGGHALELNLLFMAAKQGKPHEGYKLCPNSRQSRLCLDFGPLISDFDIICHVLAQILQPVFSQLLLQKPHKSSNFRKMLGTYSYRFWTFVGLNLIYTSLICILLTSKKFTLLNMYYWIFRPCTHPARMAKLVATIFMGIFDLMRLYWCLKFKSNIDWIKDPSDHSSSFIISATKVDS